VRRSFETTRRQQSAGQGFTLVELLVVVGVIVLLVGVLVPLVGRAYRQGNRARSTADLQAIATALEAYRQDFGDYPRLGLVHRDAVAPNSLNNIRRNVGAAVLGKALVGPGEQARFNTPGYSNVTNAPDVYDGSRTYRAGDLVVFGTASSASFDGLVSNIFVATSVLPFQGQSPPSGTLASNDYWTRFNPFDGFDGPGFRTRLVDAMATGERYVPQGKSWGPYIRPDQFKMQGMAILDRDGAPILYVAANPQKPAATATDSDPNVNLRGESGITGLYANATPRALYDLLQNESAFNHVAGDTAAIRRKRFCTMLGDLNANGRIDGTETAGFSGPFLLWSAGPDQRHGPLLPPGANTSTNPPEGWPTRKDVENCDDIVFSPR
jgi:type II secretory pathway pseudopilin PulG